MFRKLIVLCVTLGIVAAGMAYAANVYWPSSKAELDGMAGVKVGDKAVVITNDGVVTFYYYKDSRNQWTEMSGFNKLGASALLASETDPIFLAALDDNNTKMTRTGTGSASKWPTVRAIIAWAQSVFLLKASDLSDAHNSTAVLTNLGIVTTTAPSTVEPGTVVAVYGGNTAMLGEPTGFLLIPVGGGTIKVPYYSPAE